MLPDWPGLHWKKATEIRNLRLRKRDLRPKGGSNTRGFVSCLAATPISRLSSLFLCWPDFRVVSMRSKYAVNAIPVKRRITRVRLWPNRLATRKDNPAGD
jgi:hypothetical protein